MYTLFIIREFRESIILKSIYFISCLCVIYDLYIDIVFHITIIAPIGVFP